MKAKRLPPGKSQDDDIGDDGEEGDDDDDERDEKKKKTAKVSNPWCAANLTCRHHINCTIFTEADGSGQTYEGKKAGGD